MASSTVSVMTNPLQVPADRRRRRTRTAVLDAAAELFLRQGFRRTGVDELAAAADVALSSIYANFPGGKADVYLALACRVADQHVSEMTTALESAEGSADIAMFDEYRRFHRDNPFAFRLIGLTDIDATDTELFGEARHMIFGLLDGLVTAGVAASSLPSGQARSAILRWWATVNGLLTLRAQGFVGASELDALLDAERAAIEGSATR